jgi:hypothetical protein
LATGDKVIPIHYHRQDENYSFKPDALDDVVQSFVAPLEGEDVAIKHGTVGLWIHRWNKFWVTLDSNVWWSVVRQQIMVPTR